MRAHRGIIPIIIKIENVRYPYAKVAAIGTPIEIKLSSHVDMPSTSHWFFLSALRENSAQRVVKLSDIHRTATK
jgi:hypothetical protein